MGNNAGMTDGVANRMLLSALVKRVHGNTALAEDLEKRVLDHYESAVLGRHYLEAAYRVSQAGRSETEVTELFEKAEFALAACPTGAVEILIMRCKVLWSNNDIVEAFHAVHAAGLLMDPFTVNENIMREYRFYLSQCMETLLQRQKASELSILGVLRGTLSILP